MTTLLARTRMAGGDDVAAVVALHERCSPQTLEQRFHVPLARVPEQVVRDLVEPRGGWSVLTEQGDLVIGHGCVAPLTDQVLEVGLIVDDAFQGSGVGSRMLRDLAEEATRRGFCSLVCLVEPDNDSMVRTVRRAGLDGESSYADGVVEVVIPLAADERCLEQPA